MERKPGYYVARANGYIRDVLSGKIPACRFVRQACQRQLDNLAAAKTDAFAFRFDVKAAERACRFIERLPHIKGPLARAKARFLLEPWQCFVYTTAYGWLHKWGPLATKRRFATVYLEVPRGNGKSAMLSGAGLYALAADGEAGPEVYSAAVTKDQARIVFETARKMAEQTPDLRQALGVTVGKTAIVVERTSGTFKPLASDEDSLEGLNVHFVAIDELHAHKRRAVYDVCETAMGKRDQPSMWIITTAGSDRSGICYEVRSYVVKILGQAAIDETWFGIIYTIDGVDGADGQESEADDWQSETAWRKANPNWGVSVEPAHLARMAQKAMQLPSAQANFKTKHLDVWVNADSAWLDMGAWNRCGDPALRVEDFAGEQCTIGLDLASKVDVAAKIKLFVRPVDGVDHFYIFGTYYLPTAAIFDGRNAQYQGWSTAGLLTETPGDVIDYATIEDGLVDDCKQFGPVEVAYDPWQALQLAQNMTAADVPMVEYRQTVANFSAPMKELQALVLSGRLHHDGDPILTWMVSNVVCHVDAKDNIYPRKERDENKIDGVVAAIMAVGRRIAAGLTSDPQVLYV
jgi:phage terminase large subunit-like protein